MHAYNLGDRIVDRESAAPWHPHDQESLPVISRHRNARLMSEEALNAATARLERALGRIERAVAAGFKLVILERLTAIKFPAAMRRDIYRSTDDSEQAAWLSRIASDPEIERHEMIRLIYAGKNGQMPRSYRQHWLGLGQGTVLVIRARLQRLRNFLAGPGAKIDAARRRKGLQPRP